MTTQAAPSGAEALGQPRKPRVFIPMEPVRWDPVLRVATPIMDFSGAGKYGELTVCLPHNTSFHMTAPIVTALREKMASFTDDDYLIAVGAPEVIAISCGLAFRKTGGSLNLLAWDKREKAYLLKRISL